MSENVLSLIPTDPQWQPERAVVERVLALVEELTPGMFDGSDIDVSWHDTMAVVDCGVNLERISCPLCQGRIATEWWGDLLEARCGEGFTTLAIEAPCCGGETTLDTLNYEWPCVFACFEIALWNPERSWFNEAELRAVADRLGHPVKQVLAHL